MILLMFRAHIFHILPPPLHIAMPFIYIRVIVKCPFTKQELEAALLSGQESVPDLQRSLVYDENDPRGPVCKFTELLK